MKGDATYLSKVSGVGKKSAEKIVTGLKDKFDYDEAFGETSSYSPITEDHALDTVDALTTLGYTEREARQTVVKITTESPELIKSSDILKVALKLLSK